MKFENLYIECENLEQRDEVIGVCRGEGLIFQGVSRDDELAVRVMEGCFFSMYWEPSEDAKNISYQEFISKYGKSEMKKSIEKAMADLKLNRHELSSALGMSRPYITKMLTCPQSEKAQARVVKMIDELIKNKNMKSMSCLEITGVSVDCEKIQEQQKTIKELNQALEYKDQLLARGEDELKKTHRENGKLEKIYLHRTSECEDIKLEISLNAGLIQDLNNGIERLSKENLTLKRENKDIQVHHAIVCVILIILVAWGFYV